MRDKHQYSLSDSDLLKLIRSRVNERLPFAMAGAVKILVCKFLIYATVALFLFNLLLTVQHPLIFIGVFAAFGVSVLLLAFNFAHDFAHNTIFRSTALNRFSFTVLFTLVGAHADAWRHRHVHDHHYAPNVDEYDPDLQITQLIRLTAAGKLRWYHRYQHLYAVLLYTTYSLYWVFIKDLLIYFSDEQLREKQSTWYHFYFLLQKTLYLLYLLIVPIVFSQQAWWIVLCGFLVLHVVQSVLLLLTFLITHHVENTAHPAVDRNGVIEASWLMNQVKSSNDFYPFSKAANFIFGGFNNHTAHHLFPNLNHAVYPELNRILYATLQEHGVSPNCTTWPGGVRSHLRLLRKMGRAPEKQM